MNHDFLSIARGDEIDVVFEIGRVDELDNFPLDVGREFNPILLFSSPWRTLLTDDSFVIDHSRRRRPAHRKGLQRSAGLCALLVLGELLVSPLLLHTSLLAFY